MKKVKSNLRNWLGKGLNAILPNHLDIQWHINIGRLSFTLLSVSLDYLNRWDYWPKDERVYRPEVEFLRVSWHKRDGRAVFDRTFLGYQLELDDNMKEHCKGAAYETWYWHHFSVLFFRFYREASGPIKAPLGYDNRSDY